MDSVLRNEIETVEDRLKLAMISSDIIALDQLLANNLVFTSHLGQVLSKSDDIAAHKKGDFIINGLSLSEQIIKTAGDLVIVSAHTKIAGSYKDEPANGNFRFTRVWQKLDSTWQVIAGHASIVA